MFTDVNYTYYSAHFALFTDIESCRPPKTNVMVHVGFVSIKHTNEGSRSPSPMWRGFVQSAEARIEQRQRERARDTDTALHASLYQYVGLSPEDSFKAWEGNRPTEDTEKWSVSNSGRPVSQKLNKEWGAPECTGHETRSGTTPALADGAEAVGREATEDPTPSSVKAPY